MGVTKKDVPERILELSKAMSVVWGIYQKDCNRIKEDVSKKMIEQLKAIKFERLDVMNKNDVYFGCGHQYNTPESVYEVLPRCDEERGLCITADAIIDNRDELFQIFSIDKEIWDKTTDSELILLAYQKWGQDCPKYLVGDFAFVIKDNMKNELFCARDHVGKRTLFYYESKDIFAFSTLMKPLMPLQDNIELNERWITDFLAMDSIGNETECNETVYQKIYQIPPAVSMLIRTEGVVKKQYWNPLKDVKPLILNTDSEYEEAFRAVFYEAVNCRLRSIGEIGIKMSGGIDSGSIACIASAMLSEKNKRLYSFSSIPMEEFSKKPLKNHSFDESENILSIVDFSGNIEAELLRSEGKHSLTDVDQIVDMMEQPYKMYQNMFWLTTAMEKSSKKGCKVLLSGAYGNLTISYGDFNTYAKTLFNKGRIISLIYEILTLSKCAQVSVAKISKGVFIYILPYQLKDFINSLHYKDWNPFLKSVVNPKLIKKWDVQRRFNLLGLNLRTQRTYDDKTFRQRRVDPVIFSHIASIEVKQSVYAGIVNRDPSRDKRVIEFCLSIPSDQFVRNGQDRFLIRRAMKGRMPDRIRLGHRIGIQSGDWLQRMEPHWESVFVELKEIIEDETMAKYINLEKVKNELSSVRDHNVKINGISADKFLTTIVFYRFIQWFKMSV